MRIRISGGFWSTRFGLTLLSLLLLTFVASAGIFAYFYVSYARMIDARLAGQVSQNTARVYTAPGRIFVGQNITPKNLAGYLTRSGYTEASIEGTPGRYELSASSLIIRPSESSFFNGENALRVDFAGNEIRQIRSLGDNAAVSSAEIEPELLTNLFDSSREKRRPVRFEDLPKVLVDALLSAEDKRFFDHSGFDPIRMLGAAWVDLRRGEAAQGASTLTQQLARSFFFTRERTLRRKLAELMVALQLERRFNKQEIFEFYANEIYLGNRGSFAIHGFGEAALAYFGKDVRDLNLGEAAFLAGIIRAPNRYSSSYRKPERAAEARDRVLKLMVENRAITAEQAEATRKQRLRLVAGSVDAGGAPYFVDMVKDHLLDRFTEAELLSESFRIYTTLDPALQRAAIQAVDIGMKNVDTLLARRYAAWRKKGDMTQAQVAMVALDPRTGEIRALVGGRDYGQSQLNHALARRQPGSVFKPFVYAAAFTDAVDGVGPIVTPVTTVVDEPTTFYFEDKEYTPNNYGADFRGTVTLREALTRSLNVATVKVAELVGYGRVVEVGRRMGLDPSIQPTPAVALGAYEMTPLEVAAGYSAFADHGVRAEPLYLRSVVSAQGHVLERTSPRTRPALDPRVAYIVTNILEDVVNRGTGASVRARGFTAPAAGKTGTSHDGWFAGYTSNLLCVVWVGFDDNRELGLPGSSSAAPIWAEFMKRAVTLPGYSNPQPFTPPYGVAVVLIDPRTLLLASPACPESRNEVFISGTEPTEVCGSLGGRANSQSAPASILSGIFGGSQPNTAQPANGAGSASSVRGPLSERPQPPAVGAGKPGQTAGQAPPAKEAEKKQGILQRIFGIFGDKKKKEARP